MPTSFRSASFPPHRALPNALRAGLGDRVGVDRFSRYPAEAPQAPNRRLAAPNWIALRPTLVIIPTNPSTPATPGAEAAVLELDQEGIV
jgi:ABC-type hemin transport system substrate-binding protein